MRFFIVLSVLLLLGVVHSSPAMVGGYSEPSLGLLADAHFLDIKGFIL